MSDTCSRCGVVYTKLSASICYATFQDPAWQKFDLCFDCAHSAMLFLTRTPAPKAAPKIIGYSLGHGMGEPVYASPKAETQDMNEEIKFPVLACQCPRKKEMTFGGFHVRNNEIICNLCYRPRYLKEGDKP